MFTHTDATRTAAARLERNVDLAEVVRARENDITEAWKAAVVMGDAAAAAQAGADLAALRNLLAFIGARASEAKR